MITEEWVIHLDMAYPDCCFWGEWDATAFYFSANLFCPPRILFLPHQWWLLSLPVPPQNIHQYARHVAILVSNALWCWIQDSQCMICYIQGDSCWDIGLPVRQSWRGWRPLMIQLEHWGWRHDGSQRRIRMALCMHYWCWGRLISIAHQLAWNSGRMLHLGLFWCARQLLLVGPILLCLPAPSLELCWSCVNCGPWKEISYPLPLAIV